MWIGSANRTRATELHRGWSIRSRCFNSLTILASRGDTYLLGEAYAFGVVWSFSLKSLGVLVLRFKRHDQEYKHPGNFKIGRHEIPVGLMVTTSILFLVAIANLFSKRIATIYGILFTLGLFALFTISDRINRPKMIGKKKGLEEFNLDHQADISLGGIHARPGCHPCCGPRLQPNGALTNRAAKDQSAPPRHRGDDGSHHDPPARANTI